MNRFFISVGTSVLLVACDAEQKTPAVNHLGNHHGTTTFRIAAEYGAVVEPYKSITLQVGYPSMQPVAKKIPGDRVIHVGLRSSTGVTEGEELLSRTNSNAPGVRSFVASGLERGIHRYRLYNSALNEISEARYFVFRSSDRQVVLVVDEGNWAHSLRLVRRVRGGVVLNATVPKSDANKLVKADDTLMRFIQSITIEE